MGNFVRVYTNAKELANNIKQVLDCVSSKSYSSALCKKPTEADAASCITEVFDIDANRMLIFKQGCAAKSFCEALFSQVRRGPERKVFFVSTLLNHDPATYTSLLSNLS